MEKDHELDADNGQNGNKQNRKRTETIEKSEKEKQETTISYQKQRCPARMKAGEKGLLRY